MQTLRILLAFCCQYDYVIHQMDVETAFLNGEIKSKVYVRQPQGYDDGTNRVLKLRKSLYGLRESPRRRYECFNESMLKLGFKRCEYDYCLYIKRSNGDCVYILLFVDDMLICSTNIKDINEIKGKLFKRFRIKDLGEVKNYIGIEINYDYKVGRMTLSQTKYIDVLAEKYRLKNAKLYSTPMEANLKVEPSEVIDSELQYRTLIGELLYISTGTRPDVAFATNYLSRFQNSYSITHYKYALRILKYLYFTRDIRLTYSKNIKADIIECAVDADWTGDPVDRTSTTGYVIRLFGNVIYWKSRKQTSVAKSLTSAEYIALSEAVTEIKYTSAILEKAFNVRINKAIKIFENSSAITIAKYGNYTKNSRHIEVQYHYVNEYCENGFIEVSKINSEGNVADILTKALCKLKFVKFRENLGLVTGI